MVNVGTVKVDKYTSPTDPMAMYVYASVVYLGFSRLFLVVFGGKKYVQKRTSQRGLGWVISET